MLTTSVCCGMMYEGKCELLHKYYKCAILGAVKTRGLSENCPDQPGWFLTSQEKIMVLKRQAYLVENCLYRPANQIFTLITLKF